MLHSIEVICRSEKGNCFHSSKVKVEKIDNCLPQYLGSCRNPIVFHNGSWHKLVVKKASSATDCREKRRECKRKNLFTEKSDIKTTTQRKEKSASLIYHFWGACKYHSRTFSAHANLRSLADFLRDNNDGTYVVMITMRVDLLRQKVRNDYCYKNTFTQSQPQLMQIQISKAKHTFQNLLSKKLLKLEFIS